MRIFLTFLAIVLLISCHDPKKDYPIPSKKDINEILKAVIAQDTLFDSRKPLSVDLQKIKIFKGEAVNRNHNFSNYDVNIKDLANFKINGQRFFSESDTAYFVFQNDTIIHYRMDKNVVSRFKLISLAEQNRNFDLHLKTWKPFIMISIPVFSLNQKKAYLLINDFCDMCGGGQAVFLENIAGHWKIVKRIDTWVS